MDWSVDHFAEHRNNKVGRYAVTTKNLEAGDVILQESPFVVGPLKDSEFVCLACYKPLENPIALCKTCGWPICSEECSKNLWHKEFECSVFTNCRMKYRIEHIPGPQLECITPLRFLMCIDRNRKRWATEVCAMEDHNTLRRFDEKAWEAEGNNIVWFLRDRCRLSDRFTEEMIRKVCGILDVNAFQVPVTNGVVRAIYPKTAILSHNCVANTQHSIPPDSLILTLRTTTYVSQSDELFTSYASCLLPTPLRREHLRKSKYFECTCDRCEDASELESHMNSLHCISCDKGSLLPVEPIHDFKTTWKCHFCGKKMLGNEVAILYEKISKEIEEMENIKSSDEKLKAAEQILKSYRMILHPNHAFNIQVYHTLSQLYGRAKGYTLDMLPDTLLERKILCCQKVLECLSIVGPGQTRLRGATTYELQLALRLTNKTKHEYKELNDKEYEQETERVITMLEECIIILGREHHTTNEAKLAKMADKSLDYLIKRPDLSTVVQSEVI
ncbi:hypothetical protein GE061_019422 [Apolygus lucorum]|uniref:SET domain-containing protein n=1 Tax=Apolygus lucorum TaxID=248454 RepID=A0A8S9X9R5_APOLU|nr:hypothetical protein GE061_019422 [Apolygus lucorum]